MSSVVTELQCFRSWHATGSKDSGKGKVYHTPLIECRQVLISLPLQGLENH